MKEFTLICCFEKKYLTDGRAYGRTEQRRDGQTNGGTDKASYRDAKTIYQNVIHTLILKNTILRQIIEG